MTPWPKWCLPSQTKFRMPLTLPSVRIVSSSRWTIQSLSFRVLTWNDSHFRKKNYSARNRSKRYLFLQTVLQGSSFEHGSRLRCVIGWNNYLAKKRARKNRNRLVCHYFQDKVLQADALANVDVALDIVLHQLGIVSSRNHPETDERSE